MNANRITLKSPREKAVPGIFCSVHVKIYAGAKFCCLLCRSLLSPVFTQKWNVQANHSAQKLKIIVLKKSAIFQRPSCLKNETTLQQSLDL